jgi:hypothetical protein
MMAVERVVRLGSRRLWRGFGGSPADVSRRQRASHARGVTIVRAFYLLMLLWVVQGVGTWNRLLDSAVIHPAWPASWIDSNDPRFGVSLVLGAVLVSSIWAAIAPQHRLARIALAVSFLQYVAVVNGFGKIVHNLHGPLYLAFVLTLLPRAPWEKGTTVASRQHLLTVVWMAQAVLLFAYAMTGLWKVVYSLYDAIQPAHTSMLSLDGFSVLLATRVAITEQDPVLADFVIDRPLLGWLLYVGTIYLELGSIFVIFRPRLHRAWGFGLLSFHIGTQLMMGFTFTENIALIGLFLVLSPQTVEPVSARETLGDLPGVLAVRSILHRVRPPKPVTGAPSIASG